MCDDHICITSLVAGVFNLRLYVQSDAYCIHACNLNTSIVTSVVLNTYVCIQPPL